MTAATPEPLDMLLAAVDAHGLLTLCCSVARSDGFIVGFAEGHAAGRQEVLDNIDADAAQAVRGGIVGIDVQVARAKPYVVPSWAGGPR